MTMIDEQQGIHFSPSPNGHAGRIDRPAVERAAADLLIALGADLRDEQLRETPRRMAEAYAELLTAEPFSPTTFPNERGYDELVLVRSIPFHSLCLHHLLPFQDARRRARRRRPLAPVAPEPSRQVADVRGTTHARDRSSWP
jgi:GTP cyclohydrolase I